MKKTSYVPPCDQIVEYMSRVYYNGMTTTSGGNLSIMDESGDMWISPTSVDKGTLRREDIICVKADGTIVGPHRPSSEYPFHRAIYKMRPDIKAILHAHPPVLVSFSVAGRLPDTAIFPVAKRLCGKVGYAGYAIPGSEALGDLVAAEFARGCNAILLENHGTCCAGADMADAFARFETLDFCARMQAGAIRLGEVKPLDDRQLAECEAVRNDVFTPVKDLPHTTAELECREQMCRLIRRAYRQHLFTAATGTYAWRFDDNSLLVTPHGVDRAGITAEDLVLVTAGNAYEDGKSPSHALWFIRRLFDAHPEHKAAIIAAPPSIMSYAVSHEKFDPRVIPESYIMLREMPVFTIRQAFDHPDEVANGISPRYPIAIIENSGVVSTGSSLLQPFDRLEVAEYSAQATIACRDLGGMKPITGKEIDDIVDAFKLPR